MNCELTNKLNMEDFGRPPTCLLCNSYFDRKPPNLSREGHEGIEDFKKGFKLFCKFLNVEINGRSEHILTRDDGEKNGEEVEVEEDNFRMGHPCCANCNMGLLDLLRLEKIIREAQTRQNEVLEALRMAVIDNQSSHKCQLPPVWMPVREKLIQTFDSAEVVVPCDDAYLSKQFRNETTKSVSNGDDGCNNHSYFDEGPISEGGEEVEAASYVLPDMEEPETITEQFSPRSVEQDPLWEPSAKRARGRPRKQTFSTRSTEIYEEVTPKTTMRAVTKTLTTTSSSSQVFPSRTKIKSCSVSLTRVKVKDLLNNSQAPQAKRGRGRPRKLKPCNSINTKARSSSKSTGKDAKDEEVSCKNVFYLITDELLLFKNTPIKFDSTGFTCLECSHFVEGSDYFTFQNMRAHVNDCHGEGCGDSTYQSCPLCSEDFTEGKALRNHILGEHTPHRISSRCIVVCESCWKLMPYYCFLYHTWFHKNDEEKALVLASGQKIARNVKLQLGIKELVRRPHGKGEGVHFRNVFYAITDNILLFQNTPVNFEPCGSTCMEPECGYFAEGMDYFTFQEMRSHVNDCHGEEYDRETSCRPCPLCQEEFQNGKTLRNHIFSEHTPHRLGTRNSVICESCFKTMPYYCFLYHIWFHKNPEEQKAALEGGEPISTKVKKILGLPYGKGEGGRGGGTKKRKKGKSKKKKKIASSSSSDEESENERVEEANTDPDYFPEPSPSASEVKEVQPKQQKIKSEIMEIIKSTTLKKENKQLMAKQKQLATRRFKRSKHGQGPGVNFKSVFYLITDEMFLFQNTPIKVEPRGFTCLEPKCSHFAPGADYFTFEDMSTHVNDCHGEAYERKKRIRNCPLCQKKFADGKTIRNHILSQHTPHRIGTRCTVVCVSCWKPMPYSCYLHHLWFHKSSEEKQEALQTGERISSKVKLTLGLMDKERPYMMPNKFKNGNFFFHLGKNFLYHKGILVKFSPQEFTCQEENCHTRISGSDYDTFHKFQKHVETSHKSLLKDRGIDADDLDRICPICKLEFSGLKSFKQHIFHEHSPMSVCTSCWKPIKTYSGMGKHVWLHMNEDESAAAKGNSRKDGNYFPEMETKTFHCQSCPMQFANTNNLRAHEKTHVPKHLRPKFNCTECSFQGLYRVSLRAHIESKHRPDLVTRKLECRICGRQFSHRHGHKLRIHMRSHSGETPFICEVCGKGFISQETLRTHSKSVHTTDRPFQCEFCEKTYKLDFVLKLHQRKVHKELVAPPDPETSRYSVPVKYRKEVIGPKIAFPCEHCGRVFPFKSRLKYHVKTSHPDMFSY